MQIEDLKPPIITHLDNLGYELYDLEYVKENQTNILRVSINKIDGIDIDDCIKVSESLSPFLDTLDPIPEEYVLEVSSPGAERKLRNQTEIMQNIGNYIHLETYEQKLDGELIKFQNDIIFLKIRNKIIEISYLDVTAIRLAIKM
ncbi:MAG: ribosome maturation factor RimP [Candidatus Izemoplasmatales bacterium]|jgi:ribosome maturation factor RimP|nr:ribosome maturation factor RimP [Candidatus Izemoplasmatales bacterium]MDD3865275.1 ribosome maturation factor RimP [Candidatus Izemoplasmatales bacterium]